MVMYINPVDIRVDYYIIHLIKTTLSSIGGVLDAAS